MAEGSRRLRCAMDQRMCWLQCLVEHRAVTPADYSVLTQKVTGCDCLRLSLLVMCLFWPVHSDERALVCLAGLLADLGFFVLPITHTSYRRQVTPFHAFSPLFHRF